MVLNENDSADPFSFLEDLEEQYNDVSTNPDEDWVLPSPKKLFYEKEIIDMPNHKVISPK